MDAPRKTEMIEIFECSKPAEQADEPAYGSDLNEN